MADEMRRNANIEMAWGFFLNSVREGQLLDHKWRLDDLLGIPRWSKTNATPFWTPIPSDPAPERLASDVWSNIHYGYVGRAQGLPEWLLYSGAQRIGISDAGDEFAINLGFQLWREHGRGIAANDLHRAIVASIPDWRRTGKIVAGFYNAVFLKRPHF